MKAEVKKELLKLAETAPDGLLHPSQVLEYAKSNPDSALHAEFEWNDKEAADSWRFQQASELIRAYVTILPQTTQHVRGLVSVPSDRANGGGYRRTEEVVKNDALRRQMVEDALKKIEKLQTCVSYLPELQPLFIEILAAVARFRESHEVVVKAA